MTKTSLAYIDQRIEHMIGKELHSPTPHLEHTKEAAKPRLIAGFEVTDKKQSARLIDEARGKRREVVRSYLNEKLGLLEEFRSIGIDPLAILPTAAFNRICHDSDLYFVPKKMRAGVNVNPFLIYLGDREPVDSSEWTGLQPERVRTQALVRQASIAETRRLIKIKGGRSVESYIASRSHEELMKELLTIDNRPVAEDIGGRRFMRFSTSVDGQVYDLQLPIPPDDVCETLIKAADANMEVRTVAVYGAMNFVGGVETILRQAINIHDDRLREEHERIDWMLNDPIVYVTRGIVTGVLAQFGPFPVEQAIIDRVSATDFLPVSID